MKLLIALVIFGLLSIGYANAADNCKEGESYEKDCNTCTCNDKGIYVCTLRACYDGPQFADTPEITTLHPDCNKGQSYSDGCNTCTCATNGVYACTLQFCIGNVQLHPDTA